MFIKTLSHTYDIRVNLYIHLQILEIYTFFFKLIVTTYDALNIKLLMNVEIVM